MSWPPLYLQRKDEAEADSVSGTQQLHVVLVLRFCASCLHRHWQAEHTQPSLRVKERQRQCWRCDARSRSEDPKIVGDVALSAAHGLRPGFVCREEILSCTVYSCRVVLQLASCRLAASCKIFAIIICLLLENLREKRLKKMMNQHVDCMTSADFSMRPFNVKF